MNLFEYDLIVWLKDQGENLYYMILYFKRFCDYGEIGQDCFSCEEIVKVWYDEELDYDYVIGKVKVLFVLILYFIQIVWKVIMKLGMVIVMVNNRLVVVVCYEFVGNNGGQF